MKKGRPLPLGSEHAVLGLLRLPLAFIGIALTATATAVARARDIVVVVVARLQVGDFIDGRDFTERSFAARNDLPAILLYPSRSIWG